MTNQTGEKIGKKKKTEIFEINANKAYGCICICFIIDDSTECGNCPDQRGKRRQIRKTGVVSADL